MSGSLRHIALTVEQTDRGAYCWVLIESAGGKIFVIDRARQPFSRYLRALEAGYEKLALLSASGLTMPASNDEYALFAQLEHAGVTHAS